MLELQTVALSESLVVISVELSELSVISLVLLVILSVALSESLVVISVELSELSVISLV